MKKSKLYVFTFLVIALVATLTGLGAFRYFYINAREALLEEKAQSGQREIRELGILLEQQLQAGIPSATVINNLQQSILNTDVLSEFVCMYNTSGIELCHPDPSLVGMKIDIDNSSFSSAEKEQSFLDVLRGGKMASGIRSFPENTNRNSEIVSVYPVDGTDWILASHANIKVQRAQLDNLYQLFLIGSMLITIIITVSCFWLIRIIHGKYERGMELKISGLNEEVNSLGMLNRQLEAKQQNIAVHEIPKEETSRKRLIAYRKDEIIAVDIESIVYIFLNGNIVIVSTLQQEMYTINNSLDELMRQLDNEVFYRANRQYIVNVNAIDNIWVYGRNQLRVETKPRSTEPIIISKNKVSEFKKWLDR